jgi:hypothetical protein
MTASPSWNLMVAVLKSAHATELRNAHCNP